MDNVQTSEQYLTVSQIQDIQKHLEKLTSVAGNKWSMEILKDLYNKDTHYEICDVVETTFEGNVFNFMKWLDDNTDKSQKVLVTSKMFLIGKSEHQISESDNPDKIDYLPLIDFGKFNVETKYDNWCEVLDKEVVEEIRLKNTLTEI